MVGFGHPLKVWLSLWFSGKLVSVRLSIWKYGGIIAVIRIINCSDVSILSLSLYKDIIAHATSGLFM